MGLWKSVRAAYKGVKNVKALDIELPGTCIGSLLLLWVKQVGHPKLPCSNYLLPYMSLRP